MLEGLRVLFVSVLVVLHFVSPKPNTIAINMQKPAVKAASIHKTITTTITPEVTKVTTQALKPITKIISQTTQKKVYGAWYWQPKLGRSQMWVGTDSQGNDIFVDQLPTPTAAQSEQSSSSDADTQACLEKVEAEYKPQEAAHCSVHTDQYFEQIGTCDGEFTHDFYVSLGQECGIHTRGG